MLYTLTSATFLELTSLYADALMVKEMVMGASEDDEEEELPCWVIWEEITTLAMVLFELVGKGGRGGGGGGDSIEANMVLLMNTHSD